MSGREPAEAVPSDRRAPPMGEHVDVHEARASDLDGIRELLDERRADGAFAGSSIDDVFTQVSLIEETVRHETTRRYYVAVLPDGRAAAVGGLQNDNIAQELFTERERPVEAITIYVGRSYRRKGIGGAVLRMIETAAREGGYTTLLIVSGSRDRLAYPFWIRRYGQPVRCDKDHFGPDHERMVWRCSLVE